MSYQVVASLGDQSRQSFVLENGRYRLGSGPNCELQVDFSDEVVAVAALIEVRGEAVFIQNLNEFDIYVGAQLLPPQSSTEWAPDELIQLTLNVTLALIDQDAAPAAADQEPGTTAAKSTVQIAVTIVCLVLCGYLLTSESSAPQSTQSLKFSFNDLINEIEAQAPRGSDGGADLGQLPYRWQTVLSYLTDARKADVRWGRVDPDRAVESYELLRDYYALSAPALPSDALEVKVRRYAAARIADLSSRR